MTIQHSSGDLAGKRPFMILAAALVATAMLAYTCFYLYLPGKLPFSLRPASGAPIILSPSDEQTVVRQQAPLLRKHVAVATAFDGHSDAYISVALAMQNVLKQTGDSRASVQLYGPETTFTRFIRDQGLLSGIFGELQSPDQLVDDMHSASLFPLDQNQRIDTVILGTCETDLSRYSEQLLGVWNNRDVSDKFLLMCIVHDTKDISWLDLVTPWSVRGVFHIFATSDYARREMTRKINDLASKEVVHHLGDDHEITHSAFWEYITIETFYPMFDLALAPKPNVSSLLTSAVIPGGYMLAHRDFSAVFSEFSRLLRADPTSWGYFSLDAPEADGIYKRNDQLSNPSFRLHLAEVGPVDVPKELQQAVEVHQGLDLHAFYELVNTMDIVVPAFVDGAHLDRQASYVINTAIECDVPVLANSNMRAAYPYLSDEVSVTRPIALNDMDALYMLRTRNTSFLSQEFSEGPAEFGLATNGMLNRGWRRKSFAFQRSRDMVWSVNEDVLSSLMRDNLHRLPQHY